MVELRVLAGADPGTREIRSFPCSVGRKEADLVLAAPGVWERHWILEKTEDRRFRVCPQAPATVTVNGKVAEEPHPLLNGDQLEFGSVRLQFRIAPTRQRSLKSLEIVTWVGVALLALFQMGLAACW